jgi:hypothetical protein
MTRPLLAGHEAETVKRFVRCRPHQIALPGCRQVLSVPLAPPAPQPATLWDKCHDSSFLAHGAVVSG